MDGEAERKTTHYKSSTRVKTHGNENKQNIKLNFIGFNYILDPNTYVFSKILNPILLNLPTCQA
jgi:hypothetical protein